MNRTIALIVISLIGIMASWGRTPAEVPNVHLARATSWVSDPDHIISPQTLVRADAMLDSLHHASTAEIAVAIVADLDGQDIDSYATELFELWGWVRKTVTTACW